VRIPRDIDGTKLVKALRVLGYERVRTDQRPQALPFTSARAR
jgi:hypothetical protein